VRAPVTFVRAGLVAVTVTTLACRQGDPAIDPKTPPNSPVPRIERPDDPIVAPKSPKDGG
jgi:hypothetical protein